MSAPKSTKSFAQAPMAGIPQDKGDVNKVMKQYESPDANGKDEMKARMDEIARREEAYSGGQNASGPSAPNSSYTPKRRYTDVTSPEQQFALFNISHVAQNPKSKRPACRLLGMFRTKEAAAAHAREVVVSALPDCALHVAEVGKKVVLCTSLENQRNSQYVFHKVKLITEREARLKDMHAEEFQKNREVKQKGATGLSMQAKKRRRKAAAARGREKAIEQAMRNASASGDNHGARPEMREHRAVTSAVTEAKDVPAACTVRNQNVAVVTFIPDNTPSALSEKTKPEPLVIFWQAFASADDARDYIETVGKRSIRHVNLDVVEMYEWMFPEDLDAEKITEYYRNSELTNIMSQKKRNPDAVADFEAWCAEEKVEVPKTEFIVNPETGDTTIESTGELASLDALEKTLDGKESQIPRRRIQATDGIRVGGDHATANVGSALDEIGRSGPSVRGLGTFSEPVEPDA